MLPGYVVFWWCWIADNLLPKLPATKFGLELAPMKGFKKVFCESDCLEAVKLATDELHDCHLCSAV